LAPFTGSTAPASRSWCPSGKTASRRTCFAGVSGVRRTGSSRPGSLCAAARRLHPLAGRGLLPAETGLPRRLLAIHRTCRSRRRCTPQLGVLRFHSRCLVSGSAPGLRERIADHGFHDLRVRFARVPWRALSVGGDGPSRPARSLLTFGGTHGQLTLHGAGVDDAGCPTHQSAPIAEPEAPATKSRLHVSAKSGEPRTTVRLHRDRAR
jgi:hypothetical protein